MARMVRHDMTWEQCCYEVYKRRLKFVANDRTDMSVIALLFKRSDCVSFLAALEHAAECLLQTSTDVVESREMRRITREIDDAKLFVASMALWQCELYEGDDDADRCYMPYREKWLKSISASAQKCEGEDDARIDRGWWRRRYYVASALLTIMGVPAEVADDMCANRIRSLENTDGK